MTGENSQADGGIDYRSLLVKYMKVVDHMEARLYVDACHPHDGFSAPEIAELRRIEQEIDNPGPGLG